MSLTGCLKKVEAELGSINAEDRAALMRRSLSARKEFGVASSESGRIAIEERITELQAMLPERPPIALTGQSNNEILTDEARARKTKEESRARDNAPSPEDFMLTGSDRAADVGAARGQETLFERFQAAPLWRSVLTEAVGKTPFQQAPAEQWRTWLNANAAKLGVKKDEIEWSGVTDWLDLQPGKVSRDQVRAYLDANGVKITETELGGDTEGIAKQAAVEKANNALIDHLVANESFDRRGANDYALDAARDELTDSQKRYMSADTQVLVDQLRSAYAARTRSPQNPAKYDQYQLPGGENYRELLLTLPGKSGMTDAQRKERLQAIANEMQDTSPSRYAQLYAERTSLSNEQLGEDPGSFKSNHWDQPNVLTHIRFNERTDADGARVLFIEEIQSDWGQAAKKSGIALTDAEKLEVQRPATNQQEWSRQQTLIKRGASGVPNAPMIGKTEAWVSLVLKRMIRYAVDNGFDRVAMVTGEQSAERYDLSKQVDSIAVPMVSAESRSVRITPTRGAEIKLMVGNKGDVQGYGSSSAQFSGKTLDEVIGKGLADKVMSAQAGTVLSGDGLKVGGEGMKAFYDKIVPNVANDVLKKLGGGKVGVVYGQSGRISGIPTNTFGAQPGFDITDKMREQASQGMPLFRSDQQQPVASQFAEAYTPPDATDNATLVRELGRIVNAYPERPTDDAGSDNYRAIALFNGVEIQKVASAFGKQIVGFVPKVGASDAVASIGGVTVGAYPDTIFLNGKNPRPIFSVLGHELAHTMRRDNMPMYRELVAAIHPYIKGNYGEFAKTSVADYLTDADAIKEEFIGEVLADGFSDAKFWNAVGSTNPSLVTRLFETIKDLFRRARSALNGMRGTEKYLREFDEVMRIAGEAVGRYAESQSAKEKAIASDGDARLQRGDAPDTININGVKRARNNSNGKPIAATDEALRNFWEWFGSSKVVDDQGRPRVVYHGTDKAFNKINMRKGAQGLFWFTSDKAAIEAGEVGAQGRGKIIEMYAKIDSPADWDKYDKLGLGELRRDGFDGAMLDDGDGTFTGFILDRPAQVKSATGNDGTFSPDNPDIRFSKNPSQQATGLTNKSETADKKTVLPRLGIVETPLRIILKKSRALDVWRGAFNLLELPVKIALNTKAGETFKAGIIDRYGLSDAVIDRRRAMESAMAEGAQDTKRLLDKIGTLTRSEASVLYRAATTSDQKEVDQLIRDMPPDSKDALWEIKKVVYDLGREQVRLGNLKADAFEQNKWAYLHRSYEKYEREAMENKSEAAGRSLRTRGDHYKGRGIAEMVTAEALERSLPEVWRAKFEGGKVSDAMKGQQFTRLVAREKTAPIDPEAKGKVKHVAFVPLGQPIPEKFKGYDADPNAFTLRTVKDGKAVMWRDFTEKERTRMGEIDDIRYAFAKTMQLAVQDTEVGRYFEWIANTNALPEDKLPEGAEIMDDEARLRAKLSTFRKDSWVKVPTTKVKGATVNRYGQLAGLYVPGPVWNDIRDIGSFYFDSAIGQAYDKAQTYWKISKTALSPAVHMNNVMSNTVMMQWADVQSWHLAKSIKTYVDAARGNAEAKELLARFERSGGESGSYALNEIQNDELNSIFDDLQREVLAQKGIAGIVNASAVLDLLREGEFRKALVAFGSGKAAAVTKKYTYDAMLKAYGMEDQFFRLAAFLKATSEGLSDDKAGKFARDSFLNYDIRAPWVQAARKTVLPFASFAYRAIPKLYDIVKNKPYKIMTLFAAIQLVNAIGYSGSGGDEEEERKKLPKEKSGNIWGYGMVGVPKLVRMPWNDENGSPVFLDIRRWIPVGDILDSGQQHGSLPIPQTLMPGGLFMPFGEMLLNRQGFTGKDIVLDTDSAGEKTIKNLDHLYKAMLPNFPAPSMGSTLRQMYNVTGVGPDLDPGQLDTYAWSSIFSAGTGKTDPFGREYDLTMAIASAMGVKIAAYPPDVADSAKMMEFEKNQREIKRVLNAYARQANRKGIDSEMLERRVNSGRDKLKKEADSVTQ